MDAGQVVKRFAESEFSVHLNELFDDMPDELESLLNEAHDRYLHLIDVTKGNFSASTVVQDRANFPKMVKHGESRLPVFDDDDCVEFMAACYKIPELLCRMFVANDYNWIVASGCVSDPSEIDRNNQELMNHLKNTSALEDVIQFLIQRGLLNEAGPAVSD